MKKDTKKYNGYANWATCEFNMICNNEYRFYNHVRDFVTRNINDKKIIIRSLKSLASDIMPKTDYYNVNFNEVAETWINDIKEEMEVG